MTPFFLGIFAASLLLCFILTKYVRDIANRRGWVAAPEASRHLHSTPLPRLGGVSIYFSFLLTLGIALLWAGHYPALNLGLTLKPLITILVPGTLIFLLGVYDDISPVGPYFK
ncbi:MAG: hypothetical protein JOY93_05045, partial [Acidobacteriales bacterium]|nr:hypothetical protein [Terriglobales bacterium]